MSGKINRTHTRSYIVCFCLCELPDVSKSVETEGVGRMRRCQMPTGLPSGKEGQDGGQDGGEGCTKL